MQPRPIIDAHLDLAWSAVFFNRDLTQSLADIRARERQMTDERSRGHNTVSLPELRRAGVRICVATLLARSGPEPKSQPGYKRSDLDYASQSIAYCAAHAQLAYYKLLEKQNHLCFIRTAAELDAHWQRALSDPDAPLGIILSMEGTDPVLAPEQLEEWWN